MSKQYLRVFQHIDIQKVLGNIIRDTYKCTDFRLTSQRDVDIIGLSNVKNWRVNIIVSGETNHSCNNLFHLDI